MSATGREQLIADLNAEIRLLKSNSDAFPGSLLAAAWDDSRSLLERALNELTQNTTALIPAGTYTDGGRA